MENPHQRGGKRPKPAEIHFSFERLNLDISSGLGAPISEAVLRIDLI